MKRRVVITGMGTITPVGLNVNEFWSSLVAGKGGVGRITRFDASAFSTQIAAEVKGFDPSSVIDRKELRRQDRFVHYAIVATHEALVDSKLELDREDRDRIGVLVGSGIGGTETWEAQFQKLRDFGPDRISPFFVPMMIIDMASGEISIRWNLKGPNFATVSACATSAHAIGEVKPAVRAAADCRPASQVVASASPWARAVACRRWSSQRPCCRCARASSRSAWSFSGAGSKGGATSGTRATASWDAGRTRPTGRPSWPMRGC